MITKKEITDMTKVKETIKAKPSKKYDFMTSLKSAQEFFKIAQACLEEYEKTNKLSSTEIIFVSATNYGLEIELFLKSILIMEGNEDIHGHNLLNLFNKISNQIQSNLIKTYTKLLDNKEQKVLYIRACLSINSKEKFEQAGPHPKRGTKLKQILKNNQNIFTMFRYMFEQGRSGNVEKFYFEYGYFNILCRALIKVSEEFLSPS